jgi:MoaA/NifB/PqqE/SkfB family radical SAM enzyme
MIKVHKVRMGLATNSSSTHSLILLPPDQAVYDSLVEGAEFGWEWFTAASPESKGDYLFLQLVNSLEVTVAKDVALATAEAWTGRRHNMSEYAHVDHQSMWTLPRPWDGKGGVDKEFFDDLSLFFMQPSLVVLGGNDNEDRTHALDDGTAFGLALAMDSHTNYVCRKDEKYGFWVLFDRESGNKIRMSFVSNGQSITPDKSAVPELVDIKITDYCPMGCEYCYQGSTEDGVHADRSYLMSLAWSLGDMKVFEVAIGGGEPTMHPNFVEVLQEFRRCGVVPNFTTKSLAWMRKSILRSQIIEAAGAFAYSVDSAEDVKKLVSLLNRHGIDVRKASVQYVMGNTELPELESIMTLCRESDIRLTLLGYKQDGRGSSFTPHDYNGWMDILMRVRPYDVGIDTALAKEYQQALEDAGIPNWCYEIEEGKFSMYIDAVQHTCARASYGGVIPRKLKASRLSDIGKEIKEHFSGY